MRARSIKLDFGGVKLGEFVALIYWVLVHQLARYIKNTADILHRDYADDIPQNVDDLCSLPGVGPKMAFLALQVAWNMYATVHRA